MATRRRCRPVVSIHEGGDESSRPIISIRERVDESSFLVIARTLE